jgi:transposase
MVVLFQDECHLLWGDICGYIWGKTSERIEVPITNERERQTYYGAVNLYTQECLIQTYEKGNSESTIAFLKYLQEQYPLATQIVMIWDGASYHRSDEIKFYLSDINQGLDESTWKINCMRFAPNDPRQNPIEDIWLHAKKFIREWYHLCKSFRAVKCLFKFSINCQIFDFPKLFMYGNFSQMI